MNANPRPVKSSESLRLAKARYYQKNKQTINDRTRDYHRAWFRKRSAWWRAAHEFRMILLPEGEKK